MGKEIVTTAVLRLDTQRAEKNLDALDKKLDALLAKAKKGGGVGPLFLGGAPRGGGGGGSGGGRSGGGSGPPTPDTSKLNNSIRQQEAINKLMRESGVTYGAAAQVVRAYGDQMDAAGNDAARFALKLDQAKRETTRLSSANRESTGLLARVGKGALGLVAAYASVTAILNGVQRAAGATYDKYVALEQATVSLKKVTNDLDEKAFANLVYQLETLSATSVPIATEDLISLGAAAAQMGIQSAEGIALAAETGAQLAQATDIQAEEAVKGLTRILAIQGEAVDNLDNLGSSLVELGNTSRATESEIAPIANEIARATANFDIASPVIFGYAAALAEMGAQAEGSGTALAELFKALLIAAKTGEGLEKFARVAGITSEQLKELVSKDVTQAAQVFLAGLGKYGENGVLVLDDLGLASKRVSKALLPLAANADRLQERISLSNKAFSDNSALSREAGSAFDQLSADSRRAMNAIGLLASDAFAPLADVLSIVFRWIADVAVGFRDIVHGANPLANLLKTELTEALMAFDELFDTESALSYFTAINESGESSRNAIVGLIPGIEKADFNVRSLLEKFIELGGFEGMFLTLQGLFYQLAASAARSGGGIASGILDGVSQALLGLADLAGAIRDLPLVGKVLGPVAETVAAGMRVQATIVANLAKDAKGVGDIYAEAFDTKATKAFNQAADVSNAKMKKLREETERLAKEKGKEVLSKPILDPKDLEEASEVLAKINKEIQAAKDTFAFMEKFGVDAGVAKKAVELLAEDGIKLSTEEAIRLAEELKNAEDAVSDLSSKRRALKSFAEDLEDINREAELLSRGLSFEDAADAVRLMRDAGVDAETAIRMLGERSAAEMAAVQAAFDAGTLSVEAYNRAVMSEEEFKQWKKNQEDAARIIGNLRTKFEEYRDEVNRINELVASGDLTEKQGEAAIKSLEDQMDGWERVGLAAMKAAEQAGESWGSILQFIGENIRAIGSAFDQMSQIAAARGDTRNAQLFSAAGSFAAGDWGSGAASLAQGLGLTGGGTSQFGGKKAGNMVAEGAQLGNTIWPGWGALIGAVVGAFVKTGADDFHATMEESAGKAGFVISQAEGELGKVGEKLSAFFNTFLNELQAGILADLDLAGSSFHIRGDRVRVVSNGIEKVFDSLEEGMDFFIRGILQANATVDGLGDNVRAFFEGANQFSENLGDLEKLQAGLELAQRLDFAETGIDTRSINAFRKELELAAEFGIPLEKVVALRQREIAAIKEDLSVRARGMLGAADFAGPVIELTRGMEVFNNTASKQAEMDRKRVEELNALIAAQEETLTSTEGVVTGFEQGIGVQGRFRDGIARDGEAMDSYTGQLDETTRSHIDGQRQLDKYKEELDALNASLEEPPDTFAQEEFGRLWEKALTDAGLSLLDMIEAVEGPAASVERRRELQHMQFMLQLGAQIQAAELVLATMEFVSDEARLLFEGIVGDAKQLFDDLTSGRKTLNLGAAGGGGGRRQQALEEQRRAEEEAARAAEEAAKRLEEFSDNLRRMELNARTASGTLGDLAARLDEIAESAAQAAADGASAADVLRAQRLALRSEKERLLDPFTSTRRENFATQSVDIERQRRDAIEQARILAQAESDLTGIPFDVIFDDMVADIDKGAGRMQEALNRAVVDALSLPLEQTRREMQDFRKALTDLDLMFQRGEISQARYLDLQKQIQQQQAAAVGSQALSMLDKYYSEVEGREDFRRQLEEANFALELATLQLRFNMLVAEGALAQDVIDSVGGFITFMQENPPDWDAYFAPPAGGGSSSSFGGRGFSSASVASDFSNLADAIRDFVHGFDQVDVGRFTAQAREWLKALEDFDRDIGELLSDNPAAANTVKNFASSMFGITDITKLTADQLAAIQAAIPSANINAEAINNIIDVLTAAGGLSGVGAQAPGKILAMYEGTLEATNELADRYATINSEFLDAVQAMSELGASAEQIARAEEIHQERLLGFWMEALSGFKSLSDEIRGGSFGGVNTRSLITSSSRRIDDLRSRVAADPTDFEALKELESELRNQFELQKEFSGGVVGPELQRVMQEILGISDLVQQQAIPPELQAAVADPLVLSKMDEQTTIFSDIRDMMTAQEDRQIRSDLALRTLIDENTRTLASLQRNGSPLTTQA